MGRKRKDLRALKFRNHLTKNKKKIYTKKLYDKNNNKVKE